MAMDSIYSDSSPVSASETKPREDSDAAAARGDAPLINGYTNGIEEEKYAAKAQELKIKTETPKEHKSEHKDKEHKSSSEHKHKHKDRDREKEKHHDKDRHREDKYKHGSGSSSSKDKEKHSSSKDKEKEKHRDKEHKSSSSKDKDREHKSSSSNKEKHNSSSSSHKDKHSSSHKDKHTSSSSGEKEKDKHNLSSSSNKDKDRHRDKHKEKHKEKDKDKEKHREKDQVREKDALKEREKDPLKEHKKEKDQDRKIKEMSEKHKEIEKIKVEPPDVVFKKEPEHKMNETSQIMNNTMEFSLNSVKKEVESDDDIPLAKKNKRKAGDSDDEYSPALTKKIKKETPKKRKVEDDEDFVAVKKKKTVAKEKTTKQLKTEPEKSPKKGQKKEQEETWKWWEEEKREDGVKWIFLEHKGPLFAPPYERLPKGVSFYYDGDEIKLSEETEEVATFYSKMLDHDYTTKPTFNDNFFRDWRKVMNEDEKKLITDLSKCDFTKLAAYFKQKSEERKAMSKEEKKVLKEQAEAIQKEFGYCVIDGHEEKIGNFRIEPPGLFRGRGEHPKMGMLKRRVQPEDVIINCSRNSVIPSPPEGHRWKKVQADNTVTWLACWTENVQSQIKYVMLNPSSKLKGEKDWQKYETARRLKSSVDDIRAGYRNDFKSKEMRIRQRSVALYFIDKLALRAGNEKDEDQADTVGCCSLRVEHIQLHEERNGKEYVVIFDFLGKDSIRYYNEVPIEKRVFKNLQLFMDNKQPGDDLFDRLNTSILNKHLNELMEGLTAKVFRTYNASNTLQEQLELLTNPDDPVPAKILSYNRANRAVAVLCNHQRAVSKTHAKAMENLQNKIQLKKEAVEEGERQYKHAKKAYKEGRSQKEQINVDKKKRALEKLKEQLHKLELQATDKEENKEIALGTSKLNYLDPRISVAWCKKHNVPIEKIYNKTQREKFRWAIDMAGPDFLF